jgi:hypothetical protein
MNNTQPHNEEPYEDESVWEPTMLSLGAITTIDMTEQDKRNAAKRDKTIGFHA